MGHRAGSEDTRRFCFASAARTTSMLTIRSFRTSLPGQFARVAQTTFGRTVTIIDMTGSRPRRQSGGWGWHA